MMEEYNLSDLSRTYSMKEFKSFHILLIVRGKTAGF